MSLCRLGLAVIVVLGGTPTLFGQIIQLPTFNYFSVSTSVLVPDRGGAYLGGIRRGADRRTSYGLPGGGRLFGNRAIDSSRSGGSTSVHVTVIDHDELDRATLAEAARRRGARPLADREAAETSRIFAANPDGPSAASGDPLVSVAEIRRRNATRKTTEYQQAAKFFAEGRKAAAKGKAGVAKIYYRMAEKRADPKLRLEIVRQLKALETRSNFRP